MSDHEMGSQKLSENCLSNLTGSNLSGSFAPGAGEGSIHKRFQCHARKNPDSIAVTSGTEKLTYGELDRSSSGLAERLCTSGTGDNAIIGVSMEKSPLIVIALLGILKAGCAYVPLDPRYPGDRLTGMLDDAQIPVVITTSNLKGLFSDRKTIVLCLDECLDLSSVEIPSCKDTPSNPLAYVIFTSGSTGRPKGVCCTHKGVLNLLSDFQIRQPIGPGDICSWWTSLNFDVSVYEIFSPLIEGASLIIVPEHVRTNGSDLMDWLYQNNVTSAYLPPFMAPDLDYWVTDNPGKSRLRRLLVGVEPIPEKVLMSIDNAVPSIRVINGYGPTETTICATLYEVDQANRLHENTPIGKPVQNTVLRILNEEGKPVAHGCPGELFIGGAGLADGYLNQPDLTAERFVQDPLSEDPGAMFYRTGDIVRLLDDGNLEFIGRRDFQVKIRGFRVELGEIETLLRSIEGVRESVAMLREDEPGRKQLVAYFVLSENKYVSIQSMRDYVKLYVPDYMVPAAFVRIDRIPFTPNGKTDKDALPVPQSGDFVHSGDDSGKIPANSDESTILKIFRDLIKVDDIGVRDNFFELGGHSLLAAQLVSRIRDTYGIKLALCDIFQAPTVHELALKIQSMAGQDSHGAEIFIKAVGEHAEYPISYSQMRIWYLDQLEPQTPAYNIFLANRLSGSLDIDALTKSVNLIAERRQSLRTIFRKSEPDPVQIILPHKTFSIDVADIGDVPLESRELEILKQCSREVNRGFDLSHGPLFRWLLVKQSENEHVLVFTVHHIIADGWSIGIIIRELMNIYSELVSGTPVSLAPLEFQYQDYALAQTEWMNTDAAQSQISYWKQKFAGIPESLELPTDFSRPAIQSYRGASQSIILDSELCGKIRRLGSGEGATLFMVLLAAFKALLFRYSGQTDLCVGTFVANRNRREIEDIVGFFVNTVAIRTEMRDDPSFRQLVGTVRDNALGAFANQDVPFEKILEEIKPERSLSRTPIFQTMMSLQNMPLPDLSLPGLDCKSLEIKTFRSNFDLTAWLYEVGDTLKIVMEYSADLFIESTVIRMLDRFKTLLEQVCLNPDRPLSRVEILSLEEKNTILDEWSGGRNEFHATETTVIEMFEKQAAKSPESLALLDLHSDSGIPVEITYEELNRKTNRLGRALQKRGVGPETRVALFMGPYRFMIIGMLGVLKAGAAYVPLDTKYPEKRVEFILNDTSAPVVITDEENFGRLEQILQNSESGKRPEIICIDREWKELRLFSDRELAQKPDRNNSAYIIYTSGSTGKPKGVIIEHGALESFSQSAIDLYGINDNDRVLQFASPSFDASVEEIYPSLCTGATLVLKSDASLTTLTAFAAECVEAQITVLDLPTAFWQQLTMALQEGTIVLPEKLRMVIIGGEQPAAEPIEAWLKLSKSTITLMNTYGPTETTVVATAVDLTRWKPSDPAYRIAPIGKPLKHIRAYILDSNLNLTPIGLVGELCIGGPAVARGYLNLPQKTQERFVKDPFSDNPNDRIYRTGDRVRYVQDGLIEFCGRVDRQVKVRGFRVELDEIDNALRSIPQVSEAFSVGKKRETGTVQIIAYTVLNPNSPIEVPEIRENLQTRLPDFMIPSACIILDRFPFTSGGKIDVNSLPEVNDTPSDGSDSYVAPRTPIEEVLVNIWREVFGIGRIGVQDNFFYLGGHSLLSLQIIDRVNKAGLHLTPADFIQNPTIEKQARVITTAKPSSSAGMWQCLVELQPHGSRPPVYLIHSNPGDVLGYVNLVNRLGQDQPCYGFESLGLRDLSMAHRTVEEMASYYIDEMMAFQPDPPYFLAGWCYGGIVAAEMAFQLQNQGQEVGLLALIETPFPKMENVRASYYMKKIIGLFKLGPAGWISYAQNKLKYLKKIKTGAIDSVFSLDLDAGVLANRPQVYKLNTDAMNFYSLKGFLSCPVRIFIGDILEEGFIPDIENLWTKMSQNVRRYVVPGSHLTILKEPGASVLAEKLRDYLDEVQQTG